MIVQLNVHVIKSNQTECTQSLKNAIDAINKRHGGNTVFWASSGIKPRHTVKRNKISSRYTTGWDELLIIY